MQAAQLQSTTVTQHPRNPIHRSQRGLVETPDRTHPTFARTWRLHLLRSLECPLTKGLESRTSRLRLIPLTRSPIRPPCRDSRRTRTPTTTVRYRPLRSRSAAPPYLSKDRVLVPLVLSHHAPRLTHGSLEYSRRFNRPRKCHRFAFPFNASSPSSQMASYISWVLTMHRPESCCTSLRYT